MLRLFPCSDAPILTGITAVEETQVLSFKQERELQIRRKPKCSQWQWSFTTAPSCIPSKGWRSIFLFCTFPGPALRFSDWFSPLSEVSSCLLLSTRFLLLLMVQRNPQQCPVSSNNDIAVCLPTLFLFHIFHFISYSCRNEAKKLCLWGKSSALQRFQSMLFVFRVSSSSIEPEAKFLPRHRPRVVPEAQPSSLCEVYFAVKTRLKALLYLVFFFFDGAVSSCFLWKKPVRQERHISYVYRYLAPRGLTLVVCGWRRRREKKLHAPAHTVITKVFGHSLFLVCESIINVYSSHLFTLYLMYLPLLIFGASSSVIFPWVLVCRVIFSESFCM